MGKGNKKNIKTSCVKPCQRYREAEVLIQRSITWLLDRSATTTGEILGLLRLIVKIWRLDLSHRPSCACVPHFA